ncbi:CDP-alcohol phosphatidyltransferase family protein [Amycolatopsis regifaucium]|uniref:CDP-alcohol phosphatidyltransferase n=1 Tax=Amycolatopsis regifaucium TaxID=546365 RepID=A0A154MRH4_9PSEU|nr:CDP-alcohol phosphatidyltransferase family protein [Amycolatopsis regifaucium]KZB86875.1 CDP-alcohol phosphatidyltransferase [Amycolatopsis regifaucium]OKA09306.1 CDP-alcohol phosphatidyltransferase [Amycolatopsis regifaucium]SFH58027.1 CDP-alcohol phosphatidyltransferase [Amycolatopsis regifaucium]
MLNPGVFLGVLVQLALLGSLDASVGLGPLGWLAGAAYGVAVAGFLTFGLTRSSGRSLGPADAVTLGRSALVGCVTALVADTAGRETAVMVVLASVALVLDAVDGQVARRTGTASRLGARFDMEVDAYLILVLSVVVAQSLGPWVLTIGAMRYVFVAAGRLWPWLNDPLPSSMARKTVAAVQGIVLVAAASTILPVWVGFVVTLGALGLLAWSFGRDTWWLLEQHAFGTAPVEPRPRVTVDVA